MLELHDTTLLSPLACFAPRAPTDTCTFTYGQNESAQKEQQQQQQHSLLNQPLSPGPCASQPRVQSVLLLESKLKSGLSNLCVGEGWRELEVGSRAKQTCEREVAGIRRGEKQMRYQAMGKVPTEGQIENENRRDAMITRVGCEALKREPQLSQSQQKEGLLWVKIIPSACHFCPLP